MRASPAEVRERWSLAGLLEAHDVLDRMNAELEAEQSKKQWARFKRY